LRKGEKRRKGIRRRSESRIKEKKVKRSSLK